MFEVGAPRQALARCLEKVAGPAGAAQQLGLERLRRAAMLEVMPESAGALLWLRAREQLTAQDYREVFVPQVGKIIREHGKVRLLFHLAPDFQGWTAGGVWEDVKLDLKHRGDFEKVALAGAPFWADSLAKLFAHFMPGEVRTFLREYLAEAWIWIQE